MAEFKDLLGQTLSEVQATDEVISFRTTEGREYKLWHQQDCCESVEVESISGDLESLVGNPILVAEESSSEKRPPDVPTDEPLADDSETWTFYKLATIKGHVDIRWFGTSNGYYCEAVNFDEVVPDKPSYQTEEA